MVRAFKISPLVLLGTVLLLASGQILCGTGIFWVAAMALMMLSIGVSYNMLGGLSTISGISFAVLALRTVVLSQFAKVALLQPADSDIVAPGLTITIYACFYLCVAIGILFFRQVRLKLPQPLEPESRGQTLRLYAITLPLGMAGLVLFNLMTAVYGSSSESQFNAGHSAGVALSMLVYFAIVIAVDERIASSGGQHSLNFKAALPMVVIMISGVVDAQRTNIIQPVLLYYITCYTRGYKFRRRHYVLGGSVLLAFAMFISPLILFLRADVAGRQLPDRIRVARYVLKNLNWQDVKAAEYRVVSGRSNWEDYYNNPGFAILNRFSRIRTDSNLILATAHFHYGFASIRHDLLVQIPHYFYKDKPFHDASDYLGRVSGQSAGISGTTEPAYTLIGDSYGGFGWLGVIVFGGIILPFCLAIYESMFDIGKPWGTLGLLFLATHITEGGAGSLIATVLIRTPIYLLLFSYLLGVISRGIPGGEQAGRRIGEFDVELPRPEPRFP